MPWITTWTRVTYTRMLSTCKMKPTGSQTLNERSQIVTTWTKMGVYPCRTAFCMARRSTKSATGFIYRTKTTLPNQLSPKYTGLGKTPRVRNGSMLVGTIVQRKQCTNTKSTFTPTRWLRPGSIVTTRSRRLLIDASLCSSPDTVEDDP